MNRLVAIPACNLDLLEVFETLLITAKLWHFLPARKNWGVKKCKTAGNWLSSVLIKNSGCKLRRLSEGELQIAKYENTLRSEVDSWYNFGCKSDRGLTERHLMLALKTSPPSNAILLALKLQPDFPIHFSFQPWFRCFAYYVTDLILTLRWVGVPATTGWRSKTTLSR